MNKRKSKSGMYWVNYWLKNAKKLKLVIAEPLNNDQFRLWSNAENILKNETEWIKSVQKIGWYCLDVNIEDINEIFDWL